MGPSRPLFLYFRLFNTVDSKMFNINFLPMTGFEPWTSGIEATALSTEPQPLPTDLYFLIELINVTRSQCHNQILAYYNCTMQNKALRLNVAS